jgi:hypothetical protein
MAWVTPITDRIQDDIDNLTSKAYFNIADWVRIDGNTTEIAGILATYDYPDPGLTVLIPPTVTTIPVVSEINSFINNISLLQAVAFLPVSLGLVQLKSDYIGGANQVVPNFEDINDWENNQAIMKDALPKTVTYFVQCGVSNCGQSRLWQNRFRRSTSAVT